MTPTLVITDLDGTLLNSEKKVTEETKKAIKELKNRGILFGIASGRPVESGEILCKGWGLDDSISFLVGMNGGVIFDRRTGEKESFHRISGDDILDVIHHFKKLEGLSEPLHFEVMDGNDRYVEWSNPETLAIAELFGENEIIVDFDEFLKGRTINKLVIRSAEKDQPLLVEHAKGYHNEGLNSFPTSNVLYEYVHPEINKGFGLEKVMEHYGLAPEGVVAFGDESNDVQMLKKAGTGVAMKNATAPAREASDVILDYTNDEDGIAHYINEVILKQSPHRLDQPV